MTEQTVRTRKKPGEPGRRALKSQAMREGIVAAARECYATNGIARTTMEDIARAAGVTRPTVYQYFPGKDELLLHVSALEARAVNTEIRRRCVRREDPVETIVEAAVITARVAVENIIVRRVMESIYLPAMSSDPRGAIHALNREWWRGLIERARASGALATDLDLDQIVSWLSLSQALLLIKIEGEAVSDEELRFFVRRFIVEPLMTGHGLPKAM